MHDRLEDDKRILTVTAGNLRQNHLYISKHLDFLPKDCIGPARRAGQVVRQIEIELDGLAKTIATDIGMDAKTGKPRRFIRDRAWIGKFFKHHKVQEGARLVLSRLTPRRFRLSIDLESLDLHRQLRAVEFFAGIGLVRLALEENGTKVVYANDINADKQELYEANFPPGEFCLGDIHDVHATDIPDADLFTASFPCTDLSIAGAMRGIHSGESSTFWELVRILKEAGDRRPQAVLLENVPGFLMSHEGNDFAGAVSALNELGYACDAVFLNASRFVPQSRLRLFVIGRLGAEASNPFGLQSSKIRPPVLTDFILSHPELGWDIEDLPDPPDLHPVLAAIIEDLPDNHEEWWNPKRTEYFMNQLSEKHGRAADEMIAGRNVSYATAFRRIRHGRSMAELRTDGIAGCLRTPRGGSGRQILFKAGKGRYQVRLLTPRECARLQGVPDAYHVGTSRNKALFGFGDAVCVPAISWVIEHCLLPGISREPVSTAIRRTGTQ